MSSQMSLLGFDEEARPTDRLFFALLPDAATAQRIATLAAELRQRLGLQGRLIEAGRLHITLHHVGDHVGMPASVVEAAQRAGEALSSAPFDVCFERAESFAGRPRNRPFVLRGDEPGLAAVQSFQRQLGLAMARAGLGRWVAPQFTPHVTLLYDDQLVPAQPVEPIRWQAQDFVLMHSLLGQHRHEVLGRWRLHAN
jgi:2'-5' RNA ligase